MTPAWVRTGRFRACFDRPYMASAIWAMEYVEVPDLPFVAACDRHWRMYYRPDIADRSPEEIGMIMYHEAAHLVRDHHHRGDHMPDKLRCNLATDAEINDGIRLDKPWAKGWVTPMRLGMLNDLLAEQYYAELPAGDNGSVVGQGEVTRNHAVIAAGPAGSASIGGCMPWELGSKGAPVSEAREQRIRQAVAREYQASGRGSHAGGWDRWVDEILSSRTPWRQVLGAAIRRATAVRLGMADYSYARPSRRQSATQGWIAPSMVAPHPTVALVVDTSGSMSDDRLSQAMGEVDAVIRSTGRARLVVISCDAEGTAQEVRSTAEVRLTGGGGTDMGEGISLAAKLRPAPDVCVVLTDGDTPWPDDAPSFPVIVGIISPWRPTNGPTWATTMQIEGDQ